jgi:hypothetical protein
VEPTNFLNLEIQPHEFDALYAGDVPDMSQAAQFLELQGPVVGFNPSKDGHLGLSANQVSAAPPEGAQDQSNNQHVGMALLPENLDGDPGLYDHVLNRRKSGYANGIRYWAKHFAPLTSSDAVKVPDS